MKTSVVYPDHGLHLSYCNNRGNIIHPARVPSLPSDLSLLRVRICHSYGTISRFSNYLVAVLAVAAPSPHLPPSAASAPDVYSATIRSLSVCPYVSRAKHLFPLEKKHTAMSLYRPPRGVFQTGLYSVYATHLRPHKPSMSV